MVASIICLSWFTFCHSGNLLPSMMCLSLFTLKAVRMVAFIICLAWFTRGFTL